MDELGEGMSRFARTKRTYTRKTPTSEEYHEETVEGPQPRSRRGANAANDDDAGPTRRSAVCPAGMARGPSAPQQASTSRLRQPSQTGYNSAASNLPSRNAPGVPQPRGLRQPQNWAPTQQASEASEEGRRHYSMGVRPRQPQAQLAQLDEGAPMQPPVRRSIVQPRAGNVQRQALPQLQPCASTRAYSTRTAGGPAYSRADEATALELEGEEMSRTTTRNVTEIGGRNIIREQSQSRLVKPKSWKLPSAAPMTGAKRAPASQGGTTLGEEVGTKLVAMHKAKPSTALKAIGTRTYETVAPTVMTETGPKELDSQVTIAQTVIRVPGESEVVQHHVSTVDRTRTGVAIAKETEVQKISGRGKVPGSVKSQEVISVVSTLSVTEGVKSASKKVFYERGIPKPGYRSQLPTPAQVRILVQQETEDVDKAKTLIAPELESFRASTYVIRQHATTERLTANAVQCDQNLATVSQPHCNPDEELEDPSPELLANILNTEERGLEMDDMPSRVFDYLFSSEDVQVKVDVSAAAPPPLQDIVVPLELPVQVVEVLRNPDVQQAGFHAEQVVGAPLTDNIYIEMARSKAAPSTNIGRIGPPKKKKYKNQAMISKEKPPWGLQEIDQVVNVVGAALSETMTEDQPEEEREKEQEPPDPAEDGIEYMLELEEPKHNSRVQLRGSLKPPWFPGYVLALPEIPDLITLVKSPSQVLTAAWRATVPNIFEESSMFVA